MAFVVFLIIVITASSGEVTTIREIPMRDFRECGRMIPAYEKQYRYQIRKNETVRGFCTTKRVRVK